MNDAASLTKLLKECVGLRIGEVRVVPWSINFGSDKKDAPPRNSGKRFAVNLLNDAGCAVRSLNIEVDDTEDGQSVSWIGLAN